MTVAEEQLLPAWARNDASDGALAVRELRAVRAIGSALSGARRDDLIADAVAAIERSAGLARGGSLAQAHLMYTAALQLCNGKRVDQGLQLLGKARDLFRAAESPFANAATIALAGCQYLKADYGAALKLVQPLADSEDLRHYPRLRGKALWITGLASLSEGRPTAAIYAYQSAREAFSENGFLEAVGAVDLLLHEVRLYVGDEADPWHSLRSAMAAAVEGGDRVRLFNAFDTAADQAARQGHLKAEAHLRLEVLRWAYADPDPAGIAHALLRLAENSLRSGNAKAALTELKLARQACARISQRESRKQREADILVMEGNAKLALDPLAALAMLTGALKTYRSEGFRFHIMELCLLRARVLLAVGRQTEALADVLGGLEEFESQRGSLEQEHLRIEFSDQQRELLDLAVGLLADAPGRMADAFAYAERAHGRTLLEAFEKRSRQPEETRTHEPFLASLHPLPLDEVRRRLPKSLALVEYALLKDRLLAWVIQRDQVNLVRIAVSRASLEQLTGALLRELKGGSDDRSSLTHSQEAVFQALIAPLLRYLPATEPVVFVPDRVLAEIPFACLRDPSSGHFLVEERPTAIAASASLYLESLERDSELSQTQRSLSALLVGDPNFDHQLYPALPSLPGARKEVEAIAQLYRGSADLRVGEAASRQAVLSRGGEHAVLHIASHAVSRREVPALAYLPLAGIRGADDGTLYAKDIASSRFDHTRLVILASCDSAAGRISANEGMLSLARSFLQAGVPSAAATLWGVLDGSASELFYRFHAGLIAGQSPMIALRNAQLTLLHSSEPQLRRSSVWSGLEVFNGTSELILNKGERHGH
ncbi:MAG TPA: CHAT domain-containing protein [Thermoanaerobaculia bacterium]|nr:CHAT domain-containing protein [Thermoanaerobaculia bacterium]